MADTITIIIIIPIIFLILILVVIIKYKNSVFPSTTSKPRCEQLRDSTWRTRTCVSMMEVTRLRKKMDGRKTKKAKIKNFRFLLTLTKMFYF